MPSNRYLTHSNLRQSIFSFCPHDSFAADLGCLPLLVGGLCLVLPRTDCALFLRDVFGRDWRVSLVPLLSPSLFESVTGGSNGPLF